MTRLTSLAGILLLLALSLLLTRCSDEQIVEMETLERDMLLTWIALEREDVERAAMYNATTQQDWQLVNHQYGSAPMRPTVRQSAGRVNLWMLNLDNAIKGGQTKRAMTAINLMQNELRALRPKLGLNHPADRLYDFYYQWQDVVAASNDPMMCLLEWNEYEERFEGAVKSWEAYTSARSRFSDTLFPGYGQNAAGSEAAAVAMTQSLKSFANTLERADHTLAAEPSRMIDRLFFDYLAVVTDYPLQKPAHEAGL
jgi:hypothetical protein